MLNKRLRINKSGVALILTIIIMTALSIMGVSFLQLLKSDQRTALWKTNTLANNGALEAAVRAGFQEIRNMSMPESDGYSSNYFGSTIESAEDKSSYFYFKNVIRATNTMLNIYRYGPEVDNILRDNLGELLKNKPDLKKLADAMKIDRMQIRSLSEITKVYGVGSATYDKVLPYLTTQPQDNADFVMNIIDYGQVESIILPTTLTATNRNFIGSLNGASVQIISGPGKDQVRRIESATINTLTLETPWATLPTNQSYYRIYSYVCPLNFNGASRELVEANLQVLLPYFQLYESSPEISVIGNYTSEGDVTFLGQLYKARVR